MNQVTIIFNDLITSNTDNQRLKLVGYTKGGNKIYTRK